MVPLFDRRHHSVPRSLTALLVCCGFFILASCGQEDPDANPATATPPSSPEGVADSAAQATVGGVDPAGPLPRGSELPIDAKANPAPAGAADCPYLDGAWLERTTGQRLTGVGLDERFDPPACVFWSFEDVPQATVLVRHMVDNDQAVAVVDSHAPVDSTLKALKPEGWSGGRRGGEPGSDNLGAAGSQQEPGSVYAVWKGPWAVVVTTAQEQSIKAQTIAKETIRTLGL